MKSFFSCFSPKWPEPTVAEISLPRDGLLYWTQNSWHKSFYFISMKLLQQHSSHPITNNNITKHLRHDSYALLRHCFKSLHLYLYLSFYLLRGVGGGSIYILRLWRGFTLTLFMFIISSPSADPVPLLLRAQLNYLDFN